MFYRISFKELFFIFHKGIKGHYRDIKYEISPTATQYVSNFQKISKNFRQHEEALRLIQFPIDGNVGDRKHCSPFDVCKREEGHLKIYFLNIFGLYKNYGKYPQKIGELN